METTQTQEDDLRILFKFTRAGGLEVLRIRFNPSSINKENEER